MRQHMAQPDLGVDTVRKHRLCAVLSRLAGSEMIFATPLPSGGSTGVGLKGPGDRRWPCKLRAASHKLIGPVRPIPHRSVQTTMPSSGRPYLPGCILRTQIAQAALRYWYRSQNAAMRHYSFRNEAQGA
jgi:hypothetical protein